MCTLLTLIAVELYTVELSTCINNMEYMLLNATDKGRHIFYVYETAAIALHSLCMCLYFTLVLDLL